VTMMVDVRRVEDRVRIMNSVQKTSGVARVPFSLRGVWVPAGARLVRMEKEGRVLGENHADAWLRRPLRRPGDVMRSANAFPVEVVISTPRNTQVAEQGWRVLNRYRYTLLYMAPRVFAFMLKRVLHLLHKDVWGGVPRVCAHPVPWRVPARGPGVGE